MEMNQYLNLFIEESREHLQALNEHLLSLETEPKNEGMVREIFRSAHTLKGMSATMGYEDMASLTHEMENVLDEVRNGKMSVSPEMMDILFQCVDYLEEMVHSISNQGDGRLDVSSVVSGLKRILSGKEVAASSALPPVGSTDVSEVNLLQDEELDWTFDEFELTVIRQSMESGFTVFWVRTAISIDCVMKAARAYIVYSGLEAHGEIIKCVPPVEELEQEKMDRLFDIVLITDKQNEDLEKVVLEVAEVDSVTIKQLDPHQFLYSTSNEIDVATPDVNPLEEAVQATKETAQVPKKETRTKTSSFHQTIRVDIEKLDILMNLFSELVIDRGRLEQIARELRHNGLLETVEHMNRISGDLQNTILTIRMIPLDSVFNRFPRMIRDLTRELDKKIELVIEGADTELDRTLIDEIGDPLVHLLRNSADHGIENPKQRLEAGKSETGTIFLRAYYSGNHVMIEVEDNGKGIGREGVLKKALEQNLITEQQVGSLTDKQVHELLFNSGFSTAEQISGVSGRGVGLDVVKTGIEALGGTISVDSTPGVGTRFLIQLPLTLSIISSMLVQVEHEVYAVPLSSIMETAVFSRDQIMSVQQREVIDFRGKIVPLINLKEIFQLPNQDVSLQEEVSVLIIRKGEKMAGLIIDSFIGQQDIVLKSLGKYLPNVFAISGATILGNGQVALIIDCNQLIR
ncbi:chemotaxis protein CheA [Ammoniphilus oxalaticus]|uniref:Chemotaxis protein CheA n=1 Tax=Ammoniphilus oxalaticus TaxID=66863 RepID=A0A419SJV2_9BACL|nr:chemotaxis protein CheA [Ammoniphilus oxalaticus]RKD24255.1 chemotaxis protein CheA [Ammoniphilus oxalaticus]